MRQDPRAAENHMKRESVIPIDHSSSSADGLGYNSRKERKWHPKNMHIPDAKDVAASAKKGVTRGVHVVTSVYDDFKEFLNRGNVFDLAVGVVMGAAFTGVVNSMVKDIFTPLISLGLDHVSLDNAFLILACPKNNQSKVRPDRSACTGNFTTVIQAQSAGAITWNYGVFLNNILTFLITSTIIFFLVKSYCMTFRRKKAEATEKECLYCFKKIPIKATRCAFCTSTVFDGSANDHSNDTIDTVDDEISGATAMYYHHGKH